MTQLRQPPSGPDVVGSTGGVLEPGEGFILRRSDNSVAVNNDTIPPGGFALKAQPTDAGDPDVVASIANPNPLYQYRAQATVDIESQGPGLVTMQLQVRYDGGAWTSVATNQHGNNATEARSISVDKTLSFGSLGPWSIPAGTSLMEVRTFVNASGATVAQVGTSTGPQYHVLLEETL